MLIAALFGSFAIALMLGVPVAISLGLSSAIYLFLSDIDLVPRHSDFDRFRPWNGERCRVQGRHVPFCFGLYLS